MAAPRRPGPLSLPPPVPDGDPANLHPSSGLRPGSWWACQHPDRAPVPEVTAFDRGCAGCVEILEAVTVLAGKHAGTVVVRHRSRGGVELPYTTLAVDEVTAAAEQREHR